MRIVSFVFFRSSVRFSFLFFLAFPILAFGLFGRVWSLLFLPFAFLYLYPITCASSGSIRSTGLHIGGRPAERAESERVGGGYGGLPSAAARAPLVGHPPLLGKGKERISEIMYPTRSEYLRVAVRCSEAVGPSRVEPSYAEIFATRYRPLVVGVHVWRPDFLTSYVVHVLKMACFFEAAFENGLCFPLHPFIKCVLQHFNVCPT